MSIGPETCAVSRGRPLPLGVTPSGSGSNFAVFSRHATQVSLVLVESGPNDKEWEIPLDPLVHRTGDVWHVHVANLPPACQYGYRVDRQAGQEDDKRHRYSRPVLLVDPYARSLAGSSLWAGRTSSESNGGWRGLMTADDFDWGDDRPPRHHLADTIIYEMHVRGFTRHPSSQVENPGTYRAVIEKIPYLQQLGVTAVELLPVAEFDEGDNYRKNPLTGERLVNFWGYHPLSFFAVKSGYASNQSPGGELREFKEMVKALHEADIEVILDVVFNHTGEGDERGRTVSFRGFDNTVYYLLDPETGGYRNYSGCGNTVNCNHPVVRDLIVDALCYWVTEMHVDGFRFDLASILGRGSDGTPLANPPLIERIAAHPVLADTKLIAEAWDAAGLYQVGTFPNFGRWAEWNGQFRDDLRRFVRGDQGMVSRLATRLAGSSDLYQDDGREPYHSINFITCHDGFTLADLVSYRDKHNLANGEYNADGANDNFSANHGEEGATPDEEILSLRSRQVRNFLTLLFMAHGVPMLLAGDEMGRTQQGNNNAWCQDNEISWVDWGSLEKNVALHDFVRKLISFRKEHALLRPRHFEGTERGERRLTWHGARVNKPDWAQSSQSIGMLLQGLAEEGEVYLFAHAGNQPLNVELPMSGGEAPWRVLVDTAKPLEMTASDKDGAILNTRNYQVQKKSVLVLYKKDVFQETKE